ncbi:H-NS family nucleoid-associated regulatory protein [Photobacterium indicum]|uniref:H-NS family histone-like protein n=1 Tax=Photobacterium indicum TaxID=81447 RepID=UPI003D0C4623
MTDETMKVLLNLRSLRVIAREHSLDELNEALDKLKTVIGEREKDEALAYEQDKERRDKLEAYRQMLSDDGIDVAELLDAIAKAPKVKKKHAPRPAKYRFTDDNGIEQTWTGQGRTPKFLQDKNLDDFLI